MPPLNKIETESAAPTAQAQLHTQTHTQMCAIDPVCGMKVDPAAARHSYVHDGRNYYFCCDGCRANFVAEPAKYLAGAGVGARDAAGARLAEQAVPPPHAGHGGHAMHAALAATPRAAAAASIYTCPMHPEVRADAP